jgi:hypothetical protein
MPLVTLEPTGWILSVLQFEYEGEKTAVQDSPSQSGHPDHARDTINQIVVRKIGDIHTFRKKKLRRQDFQRREHRSRYRIYSYRL